MQPEGTDLVEERALKILYIASSNIPSRTANSIHVMKMCQAFAENGHEVLLLAPDRLDTEPGVNDPYDFYGVDACFRIEKLSWVPFKGRGYVYGFLAALEARRFMPDLVYGRFLPGCFFSGILGLPVVYETHAPVEDSGRICAWIFSRLIRSKQLKCLVVISDALRHYYQEQYEIPEEFIVVAPDGADGLCESENAHVFDSNRLQVGYVGHLYHGRGIEIISGLAKSCPWADFHLVGGNASDVERWRSKIERLKNIFLHGFVPPSQTDMYRQSFDVLLAPYQRRVSLHGGKGDTSQWMSPLKVFEYMAAGKPIIASDLPVLKEVLKQGHNALVVPPDNISQWKAALIRLKDDPELRRRLGKQARDDLENKYTWKARAQKVLEVV